MSFEERGNFNGDNSSNDFEATIIAEFFEAKKNKKFSGMEKAFFEYRSFVTTCDIMNYGYGDKAPYNLENYNLIKTMYEKEKSQIYFSK